MAKKRKIATKDVCSIQISRGVMLFTSPTTCEVTFAEEPRIVALNHSHVTIHPDMACWPLVQAEIDKRYGAYPPPGLFVSRGSKP